MIDVLPKVEEWSTDQSLSTSSYKEVWASAVSQTFPSSFFLALLETNSNRVWLKVEVNGEVVIEIELQDLDLNYKLGQDHAAAVADFLVVEYFNNKWRFLPHTAIRIEKGSKISFQLKSAQGSNKKLVRGMSYWGKP